MKAFIVAGGRARWDYLIFEHSEKDVDSAEQQEQRMGRRKVYEKENRTFYNTPDVTKKRNTIERNRKGADMQTLAKPKKAEHQNLALLKQKEIEKTYGGMMNYYNQAKIKCKVATQDKNRIFVTAEGLIMPCCWTAGRMYKWWHEDPK